MIPVSRIKANQEQNLTMLHTDHFNKSLTLFGNHVLHNQCMSDALGSI
jgi:hypothetical protein